MKMPDAFDVPCEHTSIGVRIEMTLFVTHPINTGYKDMEAPDLIPLEPNPNIEQFQAGDTVRVSARVTEGNRTRTQVFEGVVIRRRGGGPGESFTVRRVTHEIGVERTFMFHSPNVEGVKVVRRGIVRRARLYYLRGLSGRAARIKERRR